MGRNRSLVVGIDGTTLFRQVDGVGRYSSRVLSTLALLDPEVHYVVIGFSDDRNKQPLVKSSSNISFEFLPLPRKAYQFVFKYLRPLPVNTFLKTRLDVMIYFNFVRTPLIANCPSITTVHDLAYLDQAGRVQPRNRRYLRRFVPRSIKESDAVIAVSNYTRERIRQVYEKRGVAVASNAVDDVFFQPVSKEAKDAVKRKYDLPGEFLLFMGSVEPRKNIGGLLKAYEQLDKNIRQKRPLVLAGKRWGLDESTNKKLDSLLDQGLVHETGYVDDEDLPAMYATADLLIFPTFYEGFGLPILEAMAASTPVITSDREPMKSIAGNAAMLIDPTNTDAITLALGKVSGDKALRKRMVSLGKKQAQKFRWHDSASTILDTIKNLTDDQTKTDDIAR